MSISTPFIRRPIATSLLMAAFVLVGIAAYPMLPVAPLPQVDFPTIIGDGEIPGRQPRDHGRHGRAAAGTPVRADRRRHADDLGQRAGLDRRSRMQFDLDRNIDAAAAGRAGGDQRGARGSCRRTCPSPPTYRKVNPVRLADPDPGGAVGRAAADRGRRLRRQRPVAADFADCRRGQVFIGGEQKRAVRVQVDPAKLAGDGPHAGGRARAR